MITHNSNYINSTAGSRIVAYIIDLIPTAIIIAFTVAVQSLGTLNAIVFYLLFPFVQPCYRIICEGQWGTTIGKRSQDLFVLDKDNNKIGMSKAILRNSPFLINSFITFWAEQEIVLHISRDIFFKMSFWEKQDYVNANYSTWYENYLWILFVVLFSDVLILIINKNRRSGHDLIGGTIVMKKLKSPNLDKF